MGRRVLVIGLDGHEPSVFDWLDRHGAVPKLAKLRERSARFLLDHGSAVRTGLAWEQFATGLSPDDAGKWAAVAFDPVRYEVWQEGTSLEPFAARLACRTVVFDPPYFDLGKSPNISGIVAWGAHDPGVLAAANPPELLQEMQDRGFAYPASRYTYGLHWQSRRRTEQMAQALAEAVRKRSEAARWLLCERLPDWDLGIVVVSELHSAIEGLWHGIDRKHPLHERVRSTEAAGKGLVEIYRAVDRLVGDFVTACPDATVIAFTMNGMGPNHSDVASMVLLPELMYRDSFRRARLRRLKSSLAPQPGVPLLEPEHSWSGLMAALLKEADPVQPFVAAPGAHRLSLDWMPAARYRPYWPRMRAFALPSFYDGRIRINLEGRESQGVVPLGEYAFIRSRLEKLLEECRDPITGQQAVKSIERPSTPDPRRMHPTESDLIVVWNGPTLGLEHPVLGRIGPLPYRRPGGHTGRYGMLWMTGEGLPPGDVGVASSFDVAPTVVDLLGEPPVAKMSGRSLFRKGNPVTAVEPADAAGVGRRIAAE